MGFASIFSFYPEITYNKIVIKNDISQYFYKIGDYIRSAMNEHERKEK